MNRDASSRLIRVALVAVGLLLAFLSVIGQLVRWQIVERHEVMARNPGQVTESSTQRGPERGTILDSQGQPLAFDIYSWEVWVEPRLVSPERAPELAQKLATSLGSELTISVAELEQLLRGNGGAYTLGKRMPYAVGEAILAWDPQDRIGVGLYPWPQRFYPQHSLGSHVLGLVAGSKTKGYVGYYGVEQAYDEYLRRTNTSLALTGASYDQLPEKWREYLPSPVGQDLVLTLDRRIQYLAERVLARALGKYGAPAGTIIVLEPQTGRILAMASLPAFDPNRPRLEPDYTIFNNPAISEQYEPGSVFKIVTVAAAIDAGLITPETIITDTGSLEHGGRMVQNADRWAHGPVTVRETLVKSLNVPTAQIALMLDKSLFYQYVRRFGFGQPTEVDLANEVPGMVKVPGNPEWSPSDLVTNAFGQGLAVTPLQMAVATAVIANGGLLVRPHVVDSMVLHGQVIKYDPAPVRRVIKPETAAIMRDMMISVVEEGATKAKVPGYTVAGKTGTAQVPIESGYHPTMTIHSFVGFAPAHDPKFVVLVKLDTPRASRWAVHTAAPTFAEVTRQLLQFLRIPPEQVAHQAAKESEVD